MILTIDVGNTFAKWKAWDGENFLSKGRFRHGTRMQNMVDAIQQYDPDEIIFADVCISDFEEQLAELYPSPKITQIKTTKKCLGVVNSYLHPEFLGIDRWLAVVEAFHLAGGEACCVIDFGTAATLDIVDDKGLHQGGHIVPGLRMLRDTLPKYTGKVRFEAENKIDLGYGLSTVEAVERGSLAMLIAWAMSEIKQFQLKFPNGKVFVTGGTVDQLIKHLPEKIIPHEDIVLDALKRIGTN